MSGIGTQQSSQNRTEPGYTVPKQPRRTTEKGLKRAPGPGQYSTVGSIGRQVDHDMATKPTVAFGSATRDHAAKVYLGPEQAKVFYGMESPGTGGDRAAGRSGGRGEADSTEENRAHRLRGEF